MRKKYLIGGAVIGVLVLGVLAYSKLGVVNGQPVSMPSPIDVVPPSTAVAPQASNATNGSGPPNTVASNGKPKSTSFNRREVLYKDLGLAVRLLSVDPKIFDKDGSSCMGHSAFLEIENLDNGPLRILYRPDTYKLFDSTTGQPLSLAVDVAGIDWVNDYTSGQRSLQENPDIGTPLGVGEKIKLSFSNNAANARPFCLPTQTADFQVEAEKMSVSVSFWVRHNDGKVQKLVVNL